MILYINSMIGQNAFVDRLGDDFDLSWMLVVDFMHEFELGVWKLFFTHLICILYVAQPDGNLVETLNEWYLFFVPDSNLSAQFYFCSRYCQISMFGSSTIRRFSNNASEMKKLAAQDFEDLLQVRDHLLNQSRFLNNPIVHCARI